MKGVSGFKFTIDGPHFSLVINPKSFLEYPMLIGVKSE
jgi:hypothetical protein